MSLQLFEMIRFIGATTCIKIQPNQEIQNRFNNSDEKQENMLRNTSGNYFFACYFGIFVAQNHLIKILS